MNKDIIIGILLLTLCIVLGSLCRRGRICEVTKVITDTLVVVDTHIIEKPVVVYQKVVDTMLYAVHDTTRIQDTLYVRLPFEKKTYKGEDYLAEISGYNASLDRIEVYPKTTTITKTQSVTKRNALALGVEASYADRAFIPIYLEYSKLLHPNVGMYGRILYNIPTQTYGFSLGAKLQVGW